VHQQVRARQGTGQPRAVSLKAREKHPRRCALAKTPHLRTVAKQNQDGRTAPAHARKRVKHDIPPFLDGKASHPDEQRTFRAARELAPGSLASRSRMKRLFIDAEWDVHHAPNAGRYQFASLRNGGDERGIERGEQSANARPHRFYDRFRGRPRKCARQGRLYVRAEVVGMPKGSSHPGRVSSAKSDCGRRQIRRVGFEDIGPRGPHESSDLVEAPQQVIGAVIRKRGALDSQHAGAAEC